MEALLRIHHRDMIDARHGLDAFGSLPVDREVAVGSPDHNQYFEIASSRIREENERALEDF
mgnify:CR=1 FL=1